MTCMECLDSMMLTIDAEVLANTPSATLILIRAELWHYAWEKVGLLYTYTIYMYSTCSIVCICTVLHAHVKHYVLCYMYMYM